jgi:hypothetical protein
MVEEATTDSPRPDLVVVNRAPDQPATGGIEGDSINAARFLAVDAVERAKSGHPGTPMGLAPLMYRLYTRHLRHDPADPGWADRDCFVLSSGHASMMLYAALHLSGYGDPLQAARDHGRSGRGARDGAFAQGVSAVIAIASSDGATPIRD